MRALEGKRFGFLGAGVIAEVLAAEAAVAAAQGEFSCHHAEEVEP